MARDLRSKCDDHCPAEVVLSALLKEGTRYPFGVTGECPLVKDDYRCHEIYGVGFYLLCTDTET